jgi:hypothetical protein
MTKDTSKILAGAGSIYVAATTASLPDPEDGIIDFSDSTSWECIGYTNGVTIEYEPEFQEIDADGYTTPIKAILTKETAKLTCSVLQSDADLFSLLMSGSSLSEDIEIGDSTCDFVAVGGNSPVEKQVIFIGTSPQGYSRAWKFPKVYVSSPLKYEGNNENVPMEVEFTALCDTSGSGGSTLFQIVEITAV